MRMSIVRLVTVSGMVAIVCLIAMAASGGFAILNLRIGGPAYERIVEAKDLVADILPPPEYVIEAYLEAQLARQDPAKLAQHRQKITQLKKDYEERRAYWAASALPADLKTKIAVTSDQLVQQFWSELEHNLLGAIERGDAAQAEQSAKALTGIYEAHRAVIDDIVTSSSAYLDDAEAKAREESVALFGIAGVTTALVLSMAFAAMFGLRRRVIMPLKSVTDYMSKLATGNHSQPVPFLDRYDEIGEMARSVAVFRDAAFEKIQREEEHALERRRNEQERGQSEAEAIERERGIVKASIGGALARLAAHDLSVRIEGTLPQAYDELRAHFQAAVKELGGAISDVVGGSNAIASSSQEISMAADDLSKRTESQAAGLEETAAALEEITSTVKQTADGAQQASQAASTAKADAEHSSSVVQEAIETMGRIEQTSRGISRFIGVIDEIAFQTNLLALNAGVEAARAGDSGRGFAVVATEVRALAQRSADAAKEIKALITAATVEIESGVSRVALTGEALKRIAEKAAEVDRSVTEIAAGARQQAASLQEVNTAVNQMDRVTQQNAAMVEETTAATHKLREEASRLMQVVKRFRMGETAAAHRAETSPKPQPRKVA
jgi:methyl-accepting chemotaxis protein